MEVAWVRPEGPEESYSAMHGSSFPPLIRRRGNEGDSEPLPQLISSVTQGDHSVSVCIPITKQESTRMAEVLTLLVSIR